MKILLATVYHYPHTGGLSVHVATLKAGLEARGHEVDVLSFSDIPEFEQKAKVRGPGFLMNKLSKGKGFVYGLKARKKMLQKLMEQVKHKNYDIVNAQEVYATFAALDAGMPVVSTVHGYLTYEALSAGNILKDSPEERFLMEEEVKAYRSTRAIITVDTRIKEYVEREAGVSGTAIRNFINVDDFRPDTENKMAYRQKHGVPADAPVFFVPRRLTKKNGVIYPILSLPAVLEKYPNAQLIYAGTGEAMEEMKRLIAERKIENNVTLLGAIPHHVIKEYYALADVALVPSVHSAGVEEATSISALEAMGSGQPLIACAVGGLKEIVDHNVDGLLVEEKNVEELSAAMIELLDHPEKGQELAKRARAKIEAEYSHLAAAEKYEEIYLGAK
ncbi:glycosyltransferase family 4 protein [Pseudobacillus badius]|uniref:glycosyltransferase family 4 protein n=1 Tax=Bacillus badius TaxID=1455 RepID=UPI0007B0641D|nr:glycosyltransferase family 4 protein [Bacillus badius]KZN99975.1 glycosyl transferase family 1 [Bacillus badius]OCS86140.1 glycosyl transferase family 1 [Bacillus badius]OVE52399.1 glycosyl transferase family 1 [Bacillus badius]TDW04135.1 glycosyltransferase involved in cell wall biosynthesis [Bacillus badius]UAT30513.1 glycosyltransferase family 4 protein [Bacillus badius]